MCELSIGKYSWYQTARWHSKSILKQLSHITGANELKKKKNTRRNTLTKRSLFLIWKFNARQQILQDKQGELNHAAWGVIAVRSQTHHKHRNRRGVDPPISHRVYLRVVTVWYDKYDINSYSGHHGSCRWPGPCFNIWHDVLSWDLGKTRRREICI